MRISLSGQTDLAPVTPSSSSSPPPGPGTPDWATLDAALDRALSLDPVGRAAYLDALEAPLRRALVPLVRDALAEDALFDHPEAVVAPLAATLAPALGGGLCEGARVGAYRLGALVGEGGMGRVYRARRVDGVFDKTVAVKLVRQALVLAGSDVAERLRRERAMLATLDHPGIARLLDGGETEDGVPYLVTEFVDGAPITDYADAHGLSVRQRVALMAEVARAVDHAHRRLVVHRDLKPSNVLVIGADGQAGARPVVLDFGIAKLLDAAEDEGSAAFPLTQTGIRLLTPAYAAPELYDPAATVTTAADVYGLGALLYELLTGRRPHDDAPLPGAPPTTEPTRPSRLVTGAAGPSQRSRQLRGDLDVICLRALHPDPARRYDSAADLAADLDRTLADEPIMARRDSAAYVVGRLLRRHRGAVGAAALALAVGLALAVVAFAQERAARAEAEIQARRATEARDFVGELFAAADPEVSGRLDVSARDVLGAGRDRVADLADQPVLQADVLTMLGRAYNGLGLFAVADSLFAEAFVIAEPALPPSDPIVVELALQHARALYSLGSLDAAAGRARQVLETPGVPTSALNRARRYYADALIVQGRPDDALRLYAVVERDRRAARDTMELVNTLNKMGEALREAGRHEAALERHREALALLDGLGGGRRDIRAIVLAGYCDTLARLGRYDEALRIHGTRAALTRDLYGEGHLYVAYDVAVRGSLEQERGRADLALPFLQDAARRLRQHLPPDHVALPRNDLFLAAALADLGRCAEALPLARAAAPPLRAFGGWHRGNAARADAVAGRCLVDAGREAEGARLIRSALEALRTDPQVRDAERGRIRSWLPAPRARALR